MAQGVRCSEDARVVLVQVGGKNNQKIALPAPAKFSYQADLTPGATPTP